MKRENNIVDFDIFWQYKNKNSKINNKYNVDKYIEFLNFYNEFINHRKKEFKKIEGEFVL